MQFSNLFGQQEMQPIYQMLIQPEFQAQPVAFPLPQLSPEEQALLQGMDPVLLAQLISNPSLLTNPANMPIAPRLPQDICIICSMPCMGTKIPLAFDRNQNRDVVACSPLCESKWRSLFLSQPAVTHPVSVLRPTPPIRKPTVTPKPVFNLTPHHQPQLQMPVLQRNSIPQPTKVLPRSTSQPKSQKASKSSSVKSLEPKASSSSGTEGKSSRKTWSAEVEAPPVVKNEPLFVVVDTNTLIEHLLQILNFKHQEHLTVVVPQIVIHELDCLKKDEQIGLKARIAVRFIHEALQENQGNLKKWMRGQSAEEIISNSLMEIPNENNDDKILNCCMYYNRNVAVNKTVLLTSDKALLVKAMMNKVRACTVEEFLRTLPPVYSNPLAAPPSIQASIQASKTEFVEKKNELTVITYEQAALRFLPPSVWRRIFGFVNPKTLARLSCVSHSFYRLSNDDEVWRLSVRNTFCDKNDILIPKTVIAKEWYLTWRKQVLTLTV